MSRRRDLLLDFVLAHFDPLCERDDQTESTPVSHDGAAPAPYFSDEGKATRCLAAILGLGCLLGALPVRFSPDSELEERIRRFAPPPGAGDDPLSGPIAEVLRRFGKGSKEGGNEQIDLTDEFLRFLDIWSDTSRDALVRAALKGDPGPTTVIDPRDLFAPLDRMPLWRSSWVAGFERFFDYVSRFGELLEAVERHPHVQNALRDFHTAFGPAPTATGMSRIDDVLSHLAKEFGAGGEPENEAGIRVLTKWRARYRRLCPSAVDETGVLVAGERFALTTNEKMCFFSRGTINGVAIRTHVRKTMTATLFDGCAFTQGALRTLSEFPSVIRLVLKRCIISEKSYYEELRTLGNLLDLEIEDRAFDDKQLGPLKDLKQLRELTLRSEMLSRAAMSDFYEARERRTSIRLFAFERDDGLEFALERAVREDQAAPG